MTRNRPQSLRRRLPLVLVLVAAALGALFLRDRLDFAALAAHRAALEAFAQAHPVAMPVVFIAAYVAIVALSLPGATVATLTGGFLFGLFPGVVYNVIGATLGAVLIFLAVRAGIGPGLRDRIDGIDGADGRVRRLMDAIRANEVPVLLAMRLVPAVPFFVANLIPAVLGVAARRFAWTTLVGILPGGLVYTWVGAGLGEVFARGESPDLGVIFEPYVLGPILGLAALALLPVVVKTVRRG